MQHLKSIYAEMKLYQSHRSCCSFIQSWRGLCSSTEVQYTVLRWTQSGQRAGPKNTRSQKTFVLEQPELIVEMNLAAKLHCNASHLFNVICCGSHTYTHRHQHTHTVFLYFVRTRSTTTLILIIVRPLF